MANMFRAMFVHSIIEVVPSVLDGIKQDESLSSGECFANPYSTLLGDYPFQLVRRSPSACDSATLDIDIEDENVYATISS